MSLSCANDPVFIITYCCCLLSVPKSKSLSRPKMRRMGEDEKPLVFAIMWGARNQTNQKKFVLQVGHNLLACKEAFIVFTWALTLRGPVKTDWRASVSFRVCLSLASRSWCWCTTRLQSKVLFWIRIRIWSVFNGLLEAEPYSEYGFGSKYFTKNFKRSLEDWRIPVPYLQYKPVLFVIKPM